MYRFLTPVLLAALCASDAAAAELLVPAGAASTWEYLDGATWRAGPAPLGYGRQGLGTVVPYGKDPQAKPIATYFRRDVDVTDPSRVATLVLRLMRDDGAVIRWNGAEIVRSNLPDGPIGPETLARRTIGGAEQAEWQTYVIPTQGLPMRKGHNALAVEIHQAYASSSDIVLDLELTGHGAGESTAVEQRAAARDAAADEIRTSLDWIHAKVARRELPIRPAARPLPATVAAAFRSLVDTPPAQGPLLKQADMLADLDDLELLLENCYAYLALRGADYRGALDAVRASITGDLPRATYVLRLSRLMAIFGDLHSIVWDAVPQGRRVDLRFVMVDGKLAAIRRDRKSTLVDGYPYVTAINGRPAEEWLAAAERLVIQGSPQIRRALALGQLEDVATVARQLGVEAGEVRLALASGDGARHVEQVVAYQQGTAPLSLGPWPWTASQVRPDRIGYLRLVEMRDDAAFVDSLHEWMRAFHDTRGLIIDLRGNVGGSQDALQALMPWLMRPGSPMKIVNLAAYRLPVAVPGPNRNGFLGLDGRGLYPVTSGVWTDAQAAQVRSFLATWRPSWQPPAGKFSAWHVMGIAPRDDGAHYDKPVIVLVDEHCASAGDNFAGAVKGLPGVTLMGTATAGTSGRRTDYQLPHTGVTVMLAQMASFKTDGDTYEGHGVTPDVLAAPTLDDQLLGRGDSVLEQAVLRLRP